MFNIILRTSSLFYSVLHVYLYNYVYKNQKEDRLTIELIGHFLFQNKCICQSACIKIAHLHVGYAVFHCLVFCSNLLASFFILHHLFNICINE